jgi:hypothetical protein
VASMHVAGLPLHPLILHATVVLVPLTALLAIAFAVLPEWRWLTRWPTAVAAVALVPLVWLTVRSGVSLENERHLVEQMKTHAARGHLLYDFVIVFAVIVVAAVFVLPGPSGLASGKGAMVGRVAYADKVMPVLVVIASLVVLVQVVLTGDSGARALWGG